MRGVAYGHLFVWHRMRFFFYWSQFSHGAVFIFFGERVEISASARKPVPTFPIRIHAPLAHHQA